MDVKAELGEPYMSFTGGYEPKNIILNVGNNSITTVLLKVISQDEEKTYTLKIKMLEEETPDYDDLIVDYKCKNSSAGSEPYLMTYTGNCSISENKEKNWKIKFLSSGTLIFAKEASIDIFLVGGGGAGGYGESTSQSTASGGGGSGYTNTYYSYKVEANKSYPIVVGAGGSYRHGGGSHWGASGGKTTAFGYSAAGGGGGFGCYGCRPPAGTGGSNGGSGCAAGATDGKPGQGTTTREFGELTGQLYATGGQGCALGCGGAGGQSNTGNGGKGGIRYIEAVYDYNKWEGKHYDYYDRDNYGGSGYSGIVAIRSIRNIRKVGNMTVTFAGASEYIDEGNGNWMIKLYTDGKLKMSANTKIDAFLVGGGGGGANGYGYNGPAYGSGGGSGYTATIKNIDIVADTEYNVVIGKGGKVGGNGTATTAFDKTVSGGKTGIVSNTNSAIQGGIGGSNGGTGSCGAGSKNGSPGQGTTTKAFGEDTGVLYASGGGGCSSSCGQNLSNEDSYYTGNGGTSGCREEADYKGWDKYKGYCVLGQTDVGQVTYATQGSNGIIIIRNAR